jgi:hypothetical protein
MLNLKDMIHFWNIVMMWLSVEDMNCVKQRKEHILEGLIIASDNIEGLLIKSSKVLKKQEEID